MPALLLATLVVVTSLEAKGVDSIEWRDRAAWNCAQTIAVRPFVMRGSEGDASAPEEAMAYLVSELASRLVGHGGITRVWLASSDQPLGADVVLTGVFVAVGPVKREGRSRFGGNNATSKCSVHLRAFRADEQTPLFELSAAREEPLTTLDATGLASIEWVVSDIANELLRKRGTCDASAVMPVTPKPFVRAPVVVVPPAPAATAIAPVAAPPLSAIPAAPIARVPAPARTTPTAPSAPLDVTVTIDSNVADAEVTIDGHFAGNAPIAAYRLAAGTHTIAVAARGYTSWQGELTVTSGSVTRVKAFLTKP
jgi:hypothetical protein